MKEKRAAKARGLEKPLLALQRLPKVWAPGLVNFFHAVVLLLTTYASPCLQNSHNLSSTYLAKSVFPVEIGRFLEERTTGKGRSVRKGSGER